MTKLSTALPSRRSNRAYRAAGAVSGCRIALYSHDTMGIGHVRRNLLIAQTLVRACNRASVLLIAGAREAAAFALPRGVDCLTLPALHKIRDGRYAPKRLGISLAKLVSLRARALSAALESFDPDVLIVDKVPRGALLELEPALEMLKSRGHARCVLGLREVLDDSDSVRQEWGRLANEQAIRDYYDAVWVYGDPRLYDLVHEYALADDVAAKVSYTGYFDQRERLRLLADPAADLRKDLGLPAGRLVLGMMGGGQDGGKLAEAFVEADFPRDTNAVLITGPFMPVNVQSRLHHIAAGRPRFRVLDFLTEPEQLLRYANQIIAMGGYNTVSEVLSFEKRALIVPRVEPRREQFIRAQRLHELGLVDFMHPNDVSPAALTAWLSAKQRPLARARGRLDFNGLARLPHLFARVVNGPTKTVK